MKKTKVVCTIGPASEQKDSLERLIGTAGMNVMRMNFSHGDYEEQGFRIKNIKALNAEGIKSCASIGILNDEQAQKLAEAGLIRFHHNINTCKSYHPVEVPSDMS